MKAKFITLLVLGCIILFSPKIISLAQQATAIKSQAVITKVGDPTDPSPVIAQPSTVPNISTAPVTGVASCPVVGGIVSTASYQGGRASGRNNGHCDGGYAYSCHCGTSGRRAKAIDVINSSRSSSGIAAKLPQINGQDVEWTLITKNYPVDGGEGGGVGNTFRAIVGADRWYLDILHLNPTLMSTNHSYRSGVDIATTVIDHIHTTIGKNITEPVSAGSNSDCDAGWIPSEVMCQ